MPKKLSATLLSKQSPMEPSSRGAESSPERPAGVLASRGRSLRPSGLRVVPPLLAHRQIGRMAGPALAAGFLQGADGHCLERLVRIVSCR